MYRVISSSIKVNKGHFQGLSMMHRKSLFTLKMLISMSLLCACFGSGKFYNLGQIKSVAVYPDFIRAGTTMTLKSAFTNSSAFNISDPVRVEEKDRHAWEEILNASKANRHLQQKTGVSLALSIITSEDVIHQIIVVSPELLIDLTTMKNLHISNSEHKMKIKDFIALHEAQK